MSNIYQDISARTNGDIYIGVVGPVRSGKSTFVTNFMQRLILPLIEEENERKRALDELPQSADGKMIMTTQPKFVPNNAVSLPMDKATAKVRLIDCVGYIVDGAEGYLDGDKMRFVNTPWSAEPMPFERAAEIGTQKVATEHSTVAVVVTTDGTVLDIARKNYVAAEERVIKELKDANKPFVVVLNSKTPDDERTLELCASLQQKYGVTVLPMDVLAADCGALENVLKSILSEFSVRRICLDLPKWMRALSNDHPVIQNILKCVKAGAENVSKMKHCNCLIDAFADCDMVSQLQLDKQEMGSGVVSYTLVPQNDLFFKVLSDEAQMDVSDEFSLMSFVTECARAKAKYLSMKDALEEADAGGYGVVCPSPNNIVLGEPQMVKQGNVYGVRLKAKSSSYHIIRVDVETDVSPMVGTEQQSKYLLEEYKNNPQAIWNTNMFGKTMFGLAAEGLNAKCSGMPVEIKQKLNKTVTKIVNENRGGLICLLL